MYCMVLKFDGLDNRDENQGLDRCNAPEIQRVGMGGNMKSLVFGLTLGRINIYFEG